MNNSRSKDYVQLQKLLEKKPLLHVNVQCKAFWSEPTVGILAQITEEPNDNGNKQCISAVHADKNDLKIRHVGIDTSAVHFTPQAHGLSTMCMKTN